MKKVKHHFISEVYQKNFSDKDGKIYFLETNGKIFSSNPDNMFKESHYNTVNGSLFIEEVFSNVEAYFGPIVKKIINREKISEEEKLILAIYISIMINRVKVRREQMRGFIKEVLDRVDSSDKDNHSFDVVEKKDVKKFKVSDIINSFNNFNQEFSASSMNASFNVYDFVYNMKWRFMIAQDGLSFISSDNPVSLCRPDAEIKFGQGSYGSRAGLAHKDVELTFPLSSSVALFADWLGSSDLDYFNVSQDSVNQINYRTIRYSNTLFSGNKGMLEDILSKS